ncbi:hypothetical protein PbDSM24746_20930 [Paenibacillus macerans]|nr:hypothetical protein PbDSM24746_20930 [Paenibacillus macerans]GBK68397.1 hypothetical protein PbJCM17693_21050 [Paenibacillus macerans]GIP10487.1 hypothetical protein J1TS5_26570 [Paenibacillus macerans]
MGDDTEHKTNIEQSGSWSLSADKPYYFRIILLDVVQKAIEKTHFESIRFGAEKPTF